jgi:membrane-associated phospholipid phosphatase
LKRTIGLHRQALLVSTLSFTISGFIKEVLKFVFGRYWPATWSQNNPSFLTDNVYGFNWFHQGVWYQSFPSGHTVAIFAVATVIWFYYPRWRWLCYLTTVAVIVGLIGNYYHFLSDIILGAYLGIATSAVVLAVWSKRVSRKEK